MVTATARGGMATSA